MKKNCVFYTKLHPVLKFGEFLLNFERSCSEIVRKLYDYRQLPGSGIYAGSYYWNLIEPAKTVNKISNAWDFIDFESRISLKFHENTTLIPQP